MTETDVIIGPFRREMFAEGLAAMLAGESDLSVTRIAADSDAAAFMNNKHPSIVILEDRPNERRQAYLPVSDAVAVILIAQEGRDVQIALRQIDRSRLRAAIGLVAKTPHPKVIALDTDHPLQPPFALPEFRNQTGSGLGSVITWLDAVFASALHNYAGIRGQDAPEAQDLAFLCAGFEHGEAIDDAEVQRRFDVLMQTPFWQVRLLHLFALDPVEVKLLCLTAAPDLDHRYAQAIGLLQNDYAQARPNATTLARLLGADLIGADIEAFLAGDRSFARFRMIRPVVSPQPLPGYQVAQGLLDLMIGVRRHSDQTWRLQTQGLPPQKALAETVAAYLTLSSPPVMLCDHANHAADEVAAALIDSGSPIMRAQCSGITGDVLAQVTDWALTARLHDAVLMFEGIAALPDALLAGLSGVNTAKLVRGTVFVGSSAPVPFGRDAVHLKVGKPGPSLQAQRWQAAGANNGLMLSDTESARLGGTLRLKLGDVEAVISMAVGHHRLGPHDSHEALILEAARRVAAQHAPETVRRPACIFGWDDIVLPAQIKPILQSIPDHISNASLVLDRWEFAARLPYGRGVGALFSGPSGVGKTMCAQVIASALGVELMQVELARCVSKYIGETEKNIDRCFTAAETASAVLLFDEADALFGKRTEIKDAHDRHANVEVAYLLQRIEAYEGLVILTSNLKANIDPAFLRRLRFVVNFPMPEAMDRERIWSLAIPRRDICASDVDTEFLARRLPLSGGSIQSVAVNAAFEAASEGCDMIHMRHIMTATRAELKKNGMLSAERALPEPDKLALEWSVS